VNDGEAHSEIYMDGAMKWGLNRLNGVYWINGSTQIVNSAKKGGVKQKRIIYQRMINGKR